jgi:hypothetical protein
VKGASAQGQEQIRLIRKFHRKMAKNSLFYCTTTEIVVGQLNQTNWGPIFQEMGQKHQVSALLLAQDLLPRFLNSKLGYACVLKLRAAEVSGTLGWAGLHGRWRDGTLDARGMVVLGVGGIHAAWLGRIARARTGHRQEKVPSRESALEGNQTNNIAANLARGDCMPMAWECHSNNMALTWQ